MDKLLLKSFYKQFPTEEACLDYLEHIRWPKGRVCTHCGARKSYKFKNGKLFKCAECKKQFSAKANTIFADSHVPLQDWFLTLYLIIAEEKTPTSIQLAIYLEVTQKTAWAMLSRISYAMEHGKSNKKKRAPKNQTFDNVMKIISSVPSQRTEK